jgi:hypothetical protein
LARLLLFFARGVPKAEPVERHRKSIMPIAAAGGMYYDKTNGRKRFKEFL